ncbi:hypothetical protein JMJ55_23900 [Belnapia sp. T6]|uniref:Uncharacterized protein n=1 Tax=Belnapia mucosa TaxID=2804532 RepID=A0ABS1V9P5_9PROT|nr:hypothetical protein [Belnapia mucosa]MBL6458384.1 hypothetical protein [Belnapia mucosa]
MAPPCGWSRTTTLLPGLDLWNPTSHPGLRGGSLQAGPTSEALETLRTPWVTAYRRNPTGMLTGMPLFSTRKKR